jgi:hypothetical protein
VMSKLAIVKDATPRSPGQTLVMPAMGAVVCAWTDAGDLLTDAAGGDDVDFRSALADAYAQLGHAVDELQSLTVELDKLFGAAEGMSAELDKLFGAE